MYKYRLEIYIGNGKSIYAPYTSDRPTAREVVYDLKSLETIELEGDIPGSFIAIDSKAVVAIDVWPDKSNEEDDE